MIRINKRLNKIFNRLGEIKSLLIKTSVEVGVIPPTRKSNPISKILRPVFEKQTVKTFVGSQLAILTMATGALTIPVSAFGVVQVDNSFGTQFDVQVKTNSSLTYPVPEAIGVSQTYNVIHRGIDIRGPLGSPVKPIASGIVKVIANQNTGWGRRIEIDHGSGVTSLYAHLGKIYVEEGQEVTIDTQIAEIGLTGWTTGPHLHLEVYEDGRTVNPIKYLESK